MIESLSRLSRRGARCALVVFVFSVFAASLWSQSNEDEQLERAKQLLRGPAEPRVRAGANICLDLNSERSMQLLLDVLNRTQPHRRDIAWEVLPSFTDPYARRLVELELKKNKKNAFVRQWCAQLLGLYNDPSYAGTVHKAMRDKAIGVRRAAARSLGQLKFEAATKSLEKAARDKDPYLRANALIALGQIDSEAHAERYLTAMHRDVDGGVRCALLGEFGDLFPDQLETQSIRALEDEDWRPRMQAVDNLESLRSKTAIDALITMTDDERPVVGHRARKALGRLTNMQWTQRNQWERWWGENREDFDFPESKGGVVVKVEASATVATYNGLQVVSDHVAFLMDKSSEMLRTRTSDGMQKELAAFDELAQVLERLDGKLVFNVFTYEDQVTPMFKESVELNSKNRKRVLTAMEKVPTKGNKDIWQALELVVSDPTLDTVYLLSSGEPEIGTYVHWNRVTEHLVDLNRFHKVTIHTVVYNSSDWYREQLEKIADATGGDFTWLD